MKEVEIHIIMINMIEDVISRLSISCLRKPVPQGGLCGRVAHLRRISSSSSGI